MKMFCIFSIKDYNFQTYFIRLYTSSSAISRPTFEYVVSTNTKTFGSILRRASDR